MSTSQQTVGSLLGLSTSSATPSTTSRTLPSQQSVVPEESSLDDNKGEEEQQQHHQQQHEPGHFSHLSLEEYCRQMGGSRAISRVLIANNGIAAVKAIRSIRKWTYETFSNDKMIQFVVMATPEDLRANAEYIHLADEFVPVPGGSNNNNYANIRLITEIAENTNCHAVWAGWGHASENPKLPDLLSTTKSKIVWIGPPSHAMRALGDKIGSTLIAQSAGVPCMPWSGDGLLVNYAKSGIPDDLYRKSCVETIEEAQLHANRIGYPIMIKASEGGGGKGIRRVEKADDLTFAFRQVQGEVPGSPIFIMKLAGTCRHLEVQLLCDSWGHSIAVFGRDCSIQRRHQKIIEEGPVVAAPPDIWHQMERSAVRLAKEVGYVGAGTVEYLYMEDGTYSFLELNPRLQVEHPVTELISGVNLPAAQLQIAMGIPLKRLPGIRKMYGESPTTDTDIDFDSRQAQTLPHHVIACRITAENPDESFQPTSGVIQELNFRSTPDVWGYFSVNAKGLVHEFADSQFGHMFAVGATREIARKNMVLALKELEIRGEIRTTIEYLRVMIEHDEFKRNKISTTWLEGILANHSITTEQPSQYLAVVSGALFRAHTYAQQQEIDYTNILLKGHLPPSKMYDQLVNYDCDLIFQDTKYKIQVTKSGPNTYDLTLLTPKQQSQQSSQQQSPSQQSQQSQQQSGSINNNNNNNNTNGQNMGTKLESNDISKSNSPINGSKSPTNGGSSAEITLPQQPITIQWERNVIAQCDIHNLSDGGYLVLLNGKKHVIHGREFPSGLRLTIDTMTCLFQHEYDPTSLRSDTQGKLVQFLVDNNSHVDKGQPVAELEVMKMYVTIRAPESGIISHIKTVGTVVESGDILASFHLDNPECVKKARIFDSIFPEQLNLTYSSAILSQSNLAEQLRTYDLRLRRLLSGYILNTTYVKDTILNFTHLLNDPLLPALQFAVLASNAAGRIPSPLLDKLLELIEDYKNSVHLYHQGISSINNPINNNTSSQSQINHQTSTLTTGTRLMTNNNNNNNNNNTSSFDYNNISINSTVQNNSPPIFPVQLLEQCIEQFLTQDNVNVIAIKAALEQYGMTTFLLQYKYGPVVHAIQTLFSYIYEFLNVEESFHLPIDLQATSITAPSLEDILHHLRKLHKDNLSLVSSLARAHHQFAPRCAFVSALLDTILFNFSQTVNSTTLINKCDLFTNLVNNNMNKNNNDNESCTTTLRDEWTSILHRLASLHDKDAIVVSLKARQALVSLRLPSQKTRLYTTMRVLESALEKRQTLLGVLGHNVMNNNNVGDVTRTLDENKVLSPISTSIAEDNKQQTVITDNQTSAIADLIDQTQPIDDVILHFLSHPYDQIRALAAEAYVRRAFQHFNVADLNVYNNPTLKQLAGHLDEEQQQQVFGQTPQLLCKWEFFMEQKGAASTTDASGSILSPLSTIPNQSRNNMTSNSSSLLKANGFRRADSLVNLAERAMQMNPSDNNTISSLHNNSNHNIALLPSTSTCTETAGSDDDDDNDDSSLTPGGMLLSPSSITPHPSQNIDPNNHTNLPLSPTSQTKAVQSEFPTVATTLKPVRRMGVLAHFNNLDELRSGFSTILASFHNAPQNRHLPRTIRYNSSLHVLYIYITSANHSTVQELSDDLNPIISAYQTLLTQHKIRRITFIVPLVQKQIKNVVSSSFSTTATASMTPTFSSVSSQHSAIPSLHLPTPLSLTSKVLPISTNGQLPVSNDDTTTTNNINNNNNTNTNTNAMLASQDFLSKSVVESPSYVTFRCANIESSSTDNNTNNQAITTPMAKQYVSLSRPVVYIEDKAIRQIEPNNALHLQLDRMSGYDYHLIPTTNRMVHLFAAIPFPSGHHHHHYHTSTLPSQSSISTPAMSSSITTKTHNMGSSSSTSTTTPTTATTTATTTTTTSLPTTLPTPSSTSSSSTQVTTTSNTIPSISPATGRMQYDGRRFFARVLVRRLNSVQRSRILNGKAIIDSQHNGELDVTMPSVGTADAHPETEVAFVEALNSLEIALTTANALTTNNVATNNKQPAPNVVEILKRGGGNGKWLFNHIFVNVLVDISIEMSATIDQVKAAAKKAANQNTSLLPDETLVNIEYVDSIIRSLTRRYADKIRRLHVTHVEFAITVRVKSPHSNEINSIPIRFICENPSSLVLHIAPFYEQYDPISNQVLLVPIHTRSLTNITYDKFKPYLFTSPSPPPPTTTTTIPTLTTIIPNDQTDVVVHDDNDILDVPISTTSTYLSQLHGYTDADAAYPTQFPYQKQRLLAASLDTIWCFDFEEIFEKAIRRSWRTTLLSYVNILTDIAFIQTPGKDGCTTTKQEQSIIMSLLITVLSVMFNYTDIDLPSAARSLRALIQAPLSVFKSAGIALILAKQLDNNTTLIQELDVMVNNGTISANDLRCIQAINKILPSLPQHLYNTVAEFAQIAVRIPSTFIEATELVLKPNPHFNPNSTDFATRHLHNGFSSYSSKYILEPIQRDVGLNKIAMVAFDIILYTPECLHYNINLDIQPRGDLGRKIVLIANDITIESGSFGTDEDHLFDLASKRAREYGIPRIYLAANSGARIGLADELKGKFKIAFIPGGDDYSKGFQYIYLTEKIYQEFKSSVVCNKITVDLSTGEKEDRYVITDIIGKKDNLGVENLRGSGCIAGETSQAYQDIFTLTYVTCRTVGIGAYLARLGQRVIQKADPAMPLLLTGFQALNKLLGKSVYTSNVQLGGPDIMYTNGVSHQIVSNDLQGCSNIIQWLSYVPKQRVIKIDPKSLFTSINGVQSLLGQTLDPITRQPTFIPNNRNQLYDPRHLLVGTTTHNPVLGLFQQFITFQERLKTMAQPPKVRSPAAALIAADTNSSIPVDDITAVLSQISLSPIQHAPLTGLFDQFSFMEVLGGWAKGVVTGRARLGGIPVGVICVDTRTIEQTIPADPAASDSNEIVRSRAGQVWFPESSYKTAQAIFDLKNEDLPIVILANWRGFSGGMQDMLNEILKFGSYIVDALHSIQQPILVYLPPMSTLRGGAWVVIDPTINFDFMEMFADPSARGGILEPEGIVDVKFRREQILSEMRRSDPTIISYNQQLTVARAANDTQHVTYIQSLIKSRETQLFPVYLQLATHFADLHDTPVRMQQKGCLNDIIPWETVRNRFYWRIKAKQLESQFVNAILTILDKSNNINSSITVNVQPNTYSSYQHQLLFQLLTTNYNLPLTDNNSNTTITTSHASTIQLARSLVYLWFTSTNIPNNITPLSIIPSYCNDVNQDMAFVHFVENGLANGWLQTYLDQQFKSLHKFKAQTELESLTAHFTKAELIAMLQSKQ